MKDYRTNDAIRALEDAKRLLAESCSQEDIHHHLNALEHRIDSALKALRDFEGKSHKEPDCDD